MDRSQILNDPEQALRLALDSHQGGLWTAIPCIVESVNFAKMTITAQPTIQGVVTDENGAEGFVNLPILGDVPLMFPSAGGFAMTLPIAVGDEVLVIFASRAIDTWWQSGGTNNQPIENRMHDLSDGFAIPAAMSNPKTLSYGTHVSSANARLMKQDASAYIEITPAGAINILAPGGFNVTGAMTVSGAITATGGVSGNLAVTGNVTATQVTAGGIGLSTHKHTGVTTGAGTSGGPTP